MAAPGFFMLIAWRLGAGVRRAVAAVWRPCWLRWCVICPGNCISELRGILIGMEVMGESMYEGSERVGVAGEARETVTGGTAWVRGADLLLAPLVLAAGVAGWAALVWWGDYPAFILPGPGVVWRKFVIVAADGTLARHAGVTLVEVLLGLALGLSAALVLGYTLGKHRRLERVAAPYIVASQSIPIVAIAPLLVIWFGSGLTSKVLVTALIAFFPTLVATLIGVRGVDHDLRDLMRSLRASRWQTFRWLELPAALPVVFGGLKLSVILAVVGAVVGEFVGADVGLGFLVNLGRGVLDTPLMFVAVFSLVVIAQALYWTVWFVEAWVLRWQR